MATIDQDALQGELKKKRICRFCLSQDPTKITNIYMRDTRIKSSAPLPIQIMAIASIEVFSNDGMPSFVCSDCTSMFEFSYQFKQMCKKADNLLRQFPLTGKWPESLIKPVYPITATVSPSIMKQTSKTTQVRMQGTQKSGVQQESLLLPKKILNSSIKTSTTPAAVITPDTSPKSDGGNKSLITNIQKSDDDCTISFLEKIENNDELSLDDIHQLVAAEEINDTEFVNMDSLPVVVVDTGSKTTKPKLLNKASVKILNKQAAQDLEPRISLPKIKQDVDGKMEIVAEILNVDQAYEDEPDPTKATPVETNVFPCPHCERTFPLLQLRDLHMKNHARDRKFQCTHCDKSFFSKYDLQRHTLIHTGDKSYKCSACDKAFSRASLLTRHEKTHTDVPKFICVHCERSFISKEDMEKHTQRHNINRPFVCKICYKGFAFKQGLERHEVIHSREQPYPCQYCDQSFSTKTKLARHLTAHAGQRPYPCKYCKKSFLLSHHLTRHLRSHKNIDDKTNAIQFMCNTCNTNFKTRDELIHHSATHANEENLVCPLCKEAFDDMSVLTNHIQEHSEGEAYACEFCDLIFMTAEKLQTHTDVEHINEMEAYHADDRAQADRQNEAGDRQAEELSDEKLQNAVNDFLHDDFSEDGNEMVTKPKTTIKQESHSPKIINQVIIRSAENKQNDENKMEDESKSLLIPLKQRKLDTSGKKVVTQTKIQQQQQQTTPKQSPQLRRKIANATNATPNRDANQPTIQSILKINKNISVTKTTSSPTATTSKMIVTNKATTPQTIKMEKDEEAIATTSTSAAAAETSIDEIIRKTRQNKNVKVQKITVTKAQAAAMAKEGRIKIKDGKIILNK